MSTIDAAVIAVFIATWLASRAIGLPVGTEAWA